MTSDSSVQTDNRLDEMPMVPVACRGCGARVLARKSSWNQTSVQWNADATARCAERAEAQRMSAHAGRGVFLACSPRSAPSSEAATVAGSGDGCDVGKRAPLGCHSRIAAGISETHWWPQ